MKEVKWNAPTLLEPGVNCFPLSSTNRAHFPVFGLKRTGPGMPRGNGTHGITALFNRVSSTCLGSFLQSLVLSSFRSSSGTACWTAQLPLATIWSSRNLRATRDTPQSPQGWRLVRLLRSVRCRSRWEASTPARLIQGKQHARTTMWKKRPTWLWRRPQDPRTFSRGPQGRLASCCKLRRPALGPQMDSICPHQRRCS